MLSGIEIFSGAGGLAKGLELSGVRHKAFVEFNKHACSTLRENFHKSTVHEGPVQDFDFTGFKNISVIAGGPPCQPFSLGGKHRGNMDERDMFPYAIKAIREITPKAFIFENVKGLLRKNFASYFNYIILQLTYPDVPKKDCEEWISHLERLEEVHTAGKYDSLKYNVIYRLINAADYGVPQKRERVIIVGIKNDLNISWSFPEPTHSEERLLWDQFITGQYWNRHDIKDQGDSLKTKSFEQKLIRLKKKYSLFSPPLKPWLTVRDSIGYLPEPTLEGTGDYPDHIFKPGARTYPGHTGSPLDAPSKTIKAGGHGVPGGENMILYPDGQVRYYTTLEAKLIQTFPKKFMVSGAWGETMRQIGNAVPVRLAKTISKSLVDKLEKTAM